jgi:hypothetical protein
MNIHNFKIFNKKGSYINWFRDSYIQVDFATDTTNAVSGEAFAITGPDSKISEIVIVDPGYNYNDANTTALLTYTFDPTGTSTTLVPAEASINFVDVSIFNPEPNNVKGIGSVNIDLSTNYIYPSLSYSGAIFLDTVSKGLIETEHLTIVESSIGYIRPYDPSSSLVFRFVGEDTEIKLFELDVDTQEIIWTDEITVDTNVYAENIPITLNIGFTSEEAGVYERRLRFYENRDGAEYLLAEFLVNAQSIHQDERYDTLLQNFAPEVNPTKIPKLFKEADINEDNPDWELLNQKGKNIVLDYAQIMPYIGTYKALINSIKWLGYEDLKIKEWFKDVKNKKKLSLEIPYNATDRSKTILYFSAEERRNLKKLNELSLIYQINRETGELDDWGVPIVENVYEYNLKEVLIKLSALKEWLEKNIIGVNTKITDITGEGVYYEHFKNLIYGVQKHSIEAIFEKKITPITLSGSSELITGDASIKLSLLELEKTRIQDFNFTFRSLINYGYNHDTSLNHDGVFGIIDADSSMINDFDASIVRVGPTCRFPYHDLNDIQWKALLVRKDAGVLGTEFVTNPLFIYENEIRHYDQTYQACTFYDTSTNASLVIEQANFRDSSNDIWNDEQIMYTINPDPSIVDFYILESSLGAISKFGGFVVLNAKTDGTSELSYNIDLNWGVPLIKFKNYTYTDSSGNYVDFEPGKEYILDMIDGKISMDVSTLNSENQIITKTNHINFTNDSSNQTITLNTEYNSGRIPLFQYDPSEYYYQQIENNYSDPSTSLLINNSIYSLEVNHIGDFAIELFSWDSWNTGYYSPYISYEGDSSVYNVWTKYPTIYSYVDASLASLDSSTPGFVLGSEDVSVMINNNLTPLFDRQIGLQNLELKRDASNNEYLEVPSITFAQDTPAAGSYSKIYNLTEHITVITSSTEFTIDPDFMEFKANDSINAVLLDKAKYDAISQIDVSIASISNNDITLDAALPDSWLTDVSTTIYFRNTTERTINRAVGDPSINIIPGTNIDHMIVNVSDYVFKENQLVAFLITDNTTGYEMGASFKVIDSSAVATANGYAHLFEGRISNYILDDSVRYTITAKHAFDQFFNTQLNVISASDVSNNFLIYHDDTYFAQNYMDSTFTYVNIPFNQEDVLEQWGANAQFHYTWSQYRYTGRIQIDVSSLLVLDSTYDDTNYMINQRNIWTVHNAADSKLIMKVWNNQLVYVFDEIGEYNIKSESYDSYGNLKSTTFEGMVTVI